MIRQQQKKIVVNNILAEFKRTGEIGRSEFLTLKLKKLNDKRFAGNLLINVKKYING